MAGHKAIWNGSAHVWHTCGCGGTPKSPVNIPAESKSILYTGSSVLTTVQGPVSKANYQVIPNLVMIDVRNEDADAWVAEGKARYATEDDYKFREGFESRR